MEQKKLVLKNSLATYVSKLLLISFIVLCASCAKNSETSSFLMRSEQDSLWQKDGWSEARFFGLTQSAFTNEYALVIDADSMSITRWYRKFPARPYAKYRLHMKMKAEGVEGESEKAGAGITLGSYEMSKDTVIQGTSDWVDFSVDFSTGHNDSYIIDCLLGKYGKAKGKIIFDDIHVELLSAKTLKPEVAIDINARQTPMSPYIYGQFIEHMGKCIYGGIWAEMMLDRKFYYVPGDSLSPWRLLGERKVQADTVDVYAPANKTIQIKGNSGIAQAGLGIIKDKKYEGRLVLKTSPSIEEIVVVLGTKGGAAADTLHIQPEQGGYQTYPIHVTSGSTSDNGVLSILAKGTGIWHVAAVSLMPEDNVDGFRSDVLELMKQLEAPIYRWPGGNFVSGYNWKDGIGDPDKRPTRYEHAWNGLEYNDVGIHEFMKLCDLLHADANIAVNTGLGTAEMAAEEVAYFNGDQSTAMGKWRAENGHPEPYDVQLWAVGNEMFGDWQLGHMPIEDYVKKHNKVAEAMWAVDPDIDLIAVGFPGHWNDMMYTNCSENMTFISEHFYRQDWHSGGLMTHVMQIPDAIKDIAEEHRRCRKELPQLKDKNIKIALDEWNYWYGPHVYGLLGTRYFLRDALGIAAGLNEFSRQSDIYYMANYAQTVNVIGAIKTTKTGSFLEGTGQVLKLYRHHFGTIPVALKGDAAPLDVAATLTEDGAYLTIAIVNPTTDNVQLDLNLAGITIPDEGQYMYITGKDDMVYNDFDTQRIDEKQMQVSLKDGVVEVPKISAGILKIAL